MPAWLGTIGVKEMKEETPMIGFRLTKGEEGHHLLFHSDLGSSARSSIDEEIEGERKVVGEEGRKGDASGGSSWHHVCMKQGWGCKACTW